MGWFKNPFAARETVQMEVQFIGCNKTLAYFDYVFHKAGADVKDVDFRAESTLEGMRYVNVYTIDLPRKKADCKEILEEIQQNRDVCSVRLL